MQLARAEDKAGQQGRRQVSGDPEDLVPHSAKARHASKRGRGAGHAPIADQEDAKLVHRAGEGDADALRLLLDRHLSSVVAVARHLLGDASEAEDIAQEAFMRLWRSAATLEIGAHGVRPWLRRVARNLALDRLRATRRLDVVDEVPEQREEAVQHQSLEGQERADRIAEVLASLPDRQRVALTLFHFEEVSQVEIAQAMDTSVDAVESLLARARRRLKRDLEEEWRALMG